MNYYTLLINRPEGWTAVFGDYSRQAVQFEATDAYAEFESRIIRSGDTHAEIDAAIAEFVR